VRAATRRTITSITPRNSLRSRTGATRIASLSKSLTLIANNHYQGKEMVNILQLKSMMTGKKVPVPPLLAERYPELAEVRG